MRHRPLRSSRCARLALVLVLLMFAVPMARAQSGDTTAGRSAALDSLFQHARALVLEGNGTAGRAIVDSVLAAAVGSPVYADALYWRAALAATAADAERDYRRVIVEYPFSAHSGDALVALAQLEMSRGDRASASEHLERFLLEHPNSPERGRAGLWLGRTLMEQNQVVRACTILLRTRAALSADAAELRNQVDYYGGRCSGVDTAVVAARSAAATAPTAVAPVATPIVAAPAPAARDASARVSGTSTATPKRDSTSREPARRDSARRDSMRSDSARREATRRDAARRDSVRRDSVRRDSVYRDSVGRESARRDSIRRVTARRDSVKRDSIQRDSVRRELAKRDTAKRNVAKRDSAKRDSVKRDASRRPEPVLPPEAARYTVQVAAYDTRAEADNLVSRLAARGFPARVVGDRSPPFRVRIGRYATARLAEDAARGLKEKGIGSFVTTTDGESVPARTPNGTTPR